MSIVGATDYRTFKKKQKTQVISNFLRPQHIFS